MLRWTKNIKQNLPFVQLPMLTDILESWSDVCLRITEPNDSIINSVIYLGPRITIQKTNRHRKLCH